MHTVKSPAEKFLNNYLTAVIYLLKTAKSRIVTVGQSEQELDRMFREADGLLDELRKKLILLLFVLAILTLTFWMGGKIFTRHAASVRPLRTSTAQTVIHPSWVDRFWSSSPTSTPTPIL